MTLAHPPGLRPRRNRGGTLATVGVAMLYAAAIASLVVDTAGWRPDMLGPWLLAQVALLAALLGWLVGRCLE